MRTENSMTEKRNTLYEELVQKSLSWSDAMQVRIMEGNIPLAFEAKAKAEKYRNYAEMLKDYLDNRKEIAYNVKE